MENDKVDEIFKTAFEKMQPKASEYTWKAISTHLNETKKTTFPKMQLIYAAISIAACILVFFGLELMHLITDSKGLSVNIKRSNLALTRLRQQSELPKTEFSSATPIYTSVPAKREMNKKKTFVLKHPKINPTPVMARSRDAVPTKDPNRPLSPNLIVLSTNEVKTAGITHLVSSGITHLDSFSATHLDSSVNSQSQPINRPQKTVEGESDHFLIALKSIKIIGQKIKKQTAHIVRMKQDSDGKQEYILNLGLARIVKVSNPQD